MSGFKCPFCGQIMSVTTATRSCWKHMFDDRPNAQFSHLELLIYKCPNDDCQKETVIAKGINGYIENKEVYIYPDSSANIYPEYIPQAIRDDYKEAYSILQHSPKACATLARRCLQGMIRDFWKIKDKNTLYEEINAIKEKVPEPQWKAIDAVRKIGNIGAHMNKDASLIVDVDPDEAHTLLRLIELLINQWYIAKHAEDELYKEVTSIGQSKKSVASTTTPPLPEEVRPAGNIE